MVQIDWSPHGWLEGRAEACVVLVFMDDATGKLVQLQFLLLGKGGISTLDSHKPIVIDGNIFQLILHKKVLTG